MTTAGCSIPIAIRIANSVLERIEAEPDFEASDKGYEDAAETICAMIASTFGAELDWLWSPWGGLEFKGKFSDHE